MREKPKAADSPSKSDADHHLKEWTSGKRGGGTVPADFGWGTNPKQWQEENGSNRPVGEVEENQKPKIP